jgi:hypothetical protein
VFTGVVEKPDYSGTIRGLDDVDRHAEMDGLVPKRRNFC